MKQCAIIYTDQRKGGVGNEKSGKLYEKDIRLVKEHMNMDVSIPVLCALQKWLV